MPKIISHTPAWLSRPSPGFDLFSPDNKKLSSEPPKLKAKQPTNGTKKRDEWLGPNRILTKKGTEVFVVVENTIRWADLRLLKENWESRKESDKSSVSSGFRSLKVPVSEQIRQLVPSPNGDLLAIVTSHTISIAILPDSTHLTRAVAGPIRLKTHTLGPTTHVLSQSSITNALWHPLGVNGTSIVTVTKDAVVRVWELSTENRWSFDSPTLAVDLKKLQYGRSADDDFSAAKLNTNRGFSLDALDMEVAAACFGGTGSKVESGWSSMTLWVAMAEGDVYALCPLLPSKWQPPSTLVPSLTTNIAAKKAFLAGENPSTDEQWQCDEQYEWLSEIDRQDPVLSMDKLGTETEKLVYDRPPKPGPIPRLQGPFNILPETIQEELEISDIHVIASRLDLAELEDQDNDEDVGDVASEGVSSTIVSLLIRSGRVYICLDLDGVEAQWLPTRKTISKLRLDLRSQPELVVFESLDTLDPQNLTEKEWPTFTPDIKSSYSFFVTCASTVHFISLKPWLDGLEKELQSSLNAGLAIRLGILLESAHTLREQILRVQYTNDEDYERSLTASVLIQNSNLGYVMFTTNGDQPHAVILDSPEEALKTEPNPEIETKSEPEAKLLTMAPVRSAYQPPEAFWAKSSLSNFIDKHIPTRYKKVLKEEIRLSGATLDVMTEAHRFLSKETYLLGLAAADLFRRCERLQEEFQDQIKRADEVALKIEQLNDDDADDVDNSGKAKGAAKIESRILEATERHERLTEKHEALRRKLAKLSGKELSNEEKAFTGEVDKMAALILKSKSADADEDDDEEEEQEDIAILARFDEVQALADDLVAQARAQSQSNHASSNVNTSIKVPPNIRKNKVADIKTLLDREDALVNAVQERLNRLTVSPA